MVITNFIDLLDRADEIAHEVSSDPNLCIYNVNDYRELIPKVLEVLLFRKQYNGLSDSEKYLCHHLRKVCNNELEMYYGSSLKAAISLLTMKFVGKLRILKTHEASPDKQKMINNSKTKMIISNIVGVTSIIQATSIFIIAFSFYLAINDYSSYGDNNIEIKRIAINSSHKMRLSFDNRGNLEDNGRIKISNRIIHERVYINGCTYSYSLMESIGYNNVNDFNAALESIMGFSRLIFDPGGCI